MVDKNKLIKTGRGRNTKPFRLWQRQDRGGIFSVRFPGGTWTSTGCTDRAQAEAFATRKLGVIDLAAQLGQPVVTKDTRSRGSEQLRVYARDFFKWEEGKQPACPWCRRKLTEGRQVGPEHAKRQRRLLERFILEDEIAQKPLRLIRRGDVMDFRARVLATCGADISDRSSSSGKRTAALTMAALSAIFREALEREDIEVNPAARLSVRSDGAPRGTFTIKELRELFPPDPTTLGPWRDLVAKTAFLIAGTCGLRRNEVRALRWANVDLAHSRLLIKESFKGNVRPGLPKWDKTREIRLPHVAAMHLKALGSNRGIVFGYADGSPRGCQWWEGAFLHAMQELKIDAKGRRLVPHSLRHSLATELWAEGVSAALLKDTFGWHSDAVLATYTGHRTALHGKGPADMIDKLLKRAT